MPRCSRDRSETSRRPRRGSRSSVAQRARRPHTSLLLYLGGEPDIVRVVHPGEKPTVKPKLARTDPQRFRDLSEPQIHIVGKAFTRAIERWELEHQEDESAATGRTIPLSYACSGCVNIFRLESVTLGTICFSLGH